MADGKEEHHGNNWPGDELQCLFGLGIMQDKVKDYEHAASLIVTALICLLNTK